MRRKTPSTRWIAIAVAGASLALAAALSTSSPAAVESNVAISAGHKCLVMTGAGDPAFVKNFNPYTATGLPSGSIVQGAFFEPLIVTGQGGLKPVPWLARSWKWSNGNKTLTLNLAQETLIPGLRCRPWSTCGRRCCRPAPRIRWNLPARPSATA